MQLALSNLNIARGYIICSRQKVKIVVKSIAEATGNK